MEFPEQVGNTGEGSSVQGVAGSSLVASAGPFAASVVARVALELALRRALDVEAVPLVPAHHVPSKDHLPGLQVDTVRLVRLDLILLGLAPAVVPDPDPEEPVAQEAVSAKPPYLQEWVGTVRRTVHKKAICSAIAPYEPRCPEAEEGNRYPSSPPLTACAHGAIAC